MLPSTPSPTSHKFIDRSLKAAGATNKVRAMFRNIYTTVSAYTTSPSTDGSQIKSEIFEIRRGVLQGDVTSPVYFILALEYILRLHDTSPGGVTLADFIVYTLG